MAPGPGLRYRSTRDPQGEVRFSQALLQGLAPDGGLYVPTCWPQLPLRSFAEDEPLARVAERLIAPFMGDDPLREQLGPIVSEAFNFPAPLVELEPEGALSVLELFHGPTAAFKDFGARFLAACFAHLHPAGSPPLMILVATS